MSRVPEILKPPPQWRQSSRLRVAASLPLELQLRITDGEITHSLRRHELRFAIQS